MAALDNLARIVEEFGVVDFILPFVIVFTLSYAVLLKAKILGENKNFNVVVALVLGLLFVIPHATGQYPAGYDPVEIMNQSLPSISLVAVAVIMAMILLGIFGRGFAAKFNPIIALIAIGFVIYIFGSSLNLWNAPNDIFSWWTEETTELMIIIAVFAVIVFFITGDGKKGFWGYAKDAGDEVGSWIENVPREPPTTPPIPPHR